MPATSQPPPPRLPELTALLHQRRAVIADHAWRDRDPAAHLAALAEVSQALDAWRDRHAAALPPRLRHFLESASFDKALASIDGAA